jgi:hypothetical protein
MKEAKLIDTVVRLCQDFFAAGGGGDITLCPRFWGLTILARRFMFIHHGRMHECIKEACAVASTKD